MSYSEIMATLNFIKNLNLVPWTGEHPYIEMLFQKFSYITLFVRVVGKILDQHFEALLSSNPGEIVMILVES